ncbi:MAG: histidine phosphatase family protein [Candidatus Hydrogenedentes bacterium]|nr:histidine phosphatase family protein [Candidatus Hydrogenedentota bacterium]
MDVYLIRHGQSEGNLAQPGAPHDPPLTGIGHAQAARVAEWLSERPIVAVYASPMTRALETGSPLAAKLRLPVQVWPCLAETARMQWNDPGNDSRHAAKCGLTAAEVNARFPGAVFEPGVAADRAWWEEQAGEGRVGAYARAAAAWAALERHHPAPDEAIAVITHGAFGSVLMSTALGAPPTDYNRYSQHNCGISLIRRAEGEIRARFVNAFGHLPVDLRTDLT